MNEKESPDFDTLDEALDRAGAEMGAAESQGLLCGMICGLGHGDRKAWGKLVLDEVDLNNVLAKECDAVLDGLFESTRQQLNDAVLEFEMLLPHEGDLLDIRVEALGEWCQGFLYGFGLGGVREKSMPEDSRELLHDIAEIARAGQQDGDALEEDEEAYVALVEYVRLGVLLINEELHPVKASPRLQ